MKDRDFDLARESIQEDVKEGRLLTYEDYMQLPSDVRYELLEGELWMPPSPSPQHQTILGFLYIALVECLAGLGRVFLAPLDVVLGKHNVLQPDLLFVARDRLEIIGTANVQGGPDLAIEILSPSTKERDRVAKRRVYSKYGVREYWIVDPATKTVEIAVNKSGSLTTCGVYHDNGIVFSPSFPTLKVDLDALFEE